MKQQVNDFQNTKTRRHGISWVRGLFPILVVTGFVIAAFCIVFAPLGCTNPKEDAKYCSQSIAPDIAKQLFQEYLQRADGNENIIHNAFTLSLCQFNAMDSIFEASDALAIRFYPGFDTEFNKEVFILCAANDKGSDNHQIILVTDKENSGFCPEVCDNESILLQGEKSPMILFEYGQQISADDARQLILAYQSDSVVTEGIVNSFCVSKDMYLTMKTIAAEYPDHNGFRIYLARGEDGTAAMIVCGVDGTNMNYTELLYVVNPAGAGLCPPFCDQRSFMY